MTRFWTRTTLLGVISLVALLVAVGLASLAPGQSGKFDQLMAAAKQEGQLTTIAIPRDWCGYGELIDSFNQKYGLRVNELSPEATSGDEIEAIKANKGSKGPQAPDVIDVGLSFGVSAKKEGLLQPYKVSAWETIPANAKDSEGYWYGDYYGAISFQINSDILKDAPQDWADLLRPAYKNAVALAGDPRSSNRAIFAVLAAGLSAANGDLNTAPDAGLKFFAELNRVRNFVPVIGRTASLAQGATPIILRWDYDALKDRDSLKGNPNVTVVVPKTGVLVGMPVQAISAFAPHPNAAKLWMEHLYSDEGQIGYLKGYCRPIRFQDLLKNKKVPADLLAKLPPSAAYEKAVFLTVEQEIKAKEVITKQWTAVVGPNVK
jgi:putative spermidine/putrescine transport system substrate-binding protein